LAFGAELQLERERRHISLASIAEVTKVPTRHLQALETERFDILPGGIFTKGILRSYCRQVGLDEDEWLSRMPGQMLPDADPEWTQFAENVSRTRVQQGPRMFWRWWGVLAIFVAVAALGWCAWIFAVRPQVGPVSGLNVSWFGSLVHAQTESTSRPQTDPQTESQAEPQQTPNPTTPPAR
jgi:cytoskeletal protein RodZ